MRCIITQVRQAETFIERVTVFDDPRKIFHLYVSSENPVAFSFMVIMEISS